MNQSVIKALGILDLFVEEKELSLQEIADISGIPKPTAYRLLSTLENCGMLYKVKVSTHDSRYGLGLKLLELGNLVSERLELREIAVPFMESLAKEINEVIHLVIAHQQEATYIEKVNSRRALSLHTKVGRSTPLYAGSGPKMLLAYMTEKEQQAVLQAPVLYTLTNRKIDKDELIKELKEIRKQQFSLSIDEQDGDTTGISFPIFNFENKVIAALAISGLSSRFNGEKLARMKELGSETAKCISKQLGFKGE